MVLERSPFLDATRDFEISVASTWERREAAYRLRHQVYCTERGYEAGEGGREMDRFDVRAEHLLLTQRSTGRVVGTVRVVAPAPHGPDADLPMQRLCGPDVLRTLPRASTGEVSRFAISKDLRDAGCAGNAILRLGLLKGVLRLSDGMGLTHWCAVMEHTLLRLLRASSIHFEALGPAVEHRGLRQPCAASIDAMLARIKRERSALWDYFTEGGALWPETTGVVDAHSVAPQVDALAA
jgi:N-acyl-L-homoserine lactone synthetase